jgi:hypothetical protein
MCGIERSQEGGFFEEHLSGGRMPAIWQCVMGDSTVYKGKFCTSVYPFISLKKI